MGKGFFRLSVTQFLNTRFKRIHPTLSGSAFHSDCAGSSRAIVGSRGGGDRGGGDLTTPKISFGGTRLNSGNVSRGPDTDTFCPPPRVLFVNTFVHAAPPGSAGSHTCRAVQL